MNTTYTRVIPRDLFNEAKLLKCIGHLALMELDRMLDIKISYQDEGFIIALMDEGSLTIQNMEISVKGIVCRFKTTYNSKGNFPLFVEYDNVDIPVFQDNGQLDEEFRQWYDEL